MSNVNKSIQEIVNSTYMPIALVYRDANLGNLGNLYKKGLIIKEKAFVDATMRHGGIITSHRYAILTSKCMDMREFEHGFARENTNYTAPFITRLLGTV